MADMKVIEAGFFVRTDPALGTNVEAEYEYRVFGRVHVELAGATDDGVVWRQQAIVEGQIGWGLYDWSVVLARVAIFPDNPRDPIDVTWADWEVPDDEDGSVRPLTTQDRRNVVALALHRARGQIVNVDTARL